MDEEELMDAGFQECRRSRPAASVNGQRPHSREMPGYPRDVDRNALLGQLSFAPTTQTTVVTTTTTTTTKFPPFLMRPPRQMRELDLKQYPLAGSPTPASLREIHFEIGGRQTIFSEAEDTSLALEQVRSVQCGVQNLN